MNDQRVHQAQNQLDQDAIDEAEIEALKAAYEEGEAAYSRGDNITENPYVDDGEYARYSKWADGWIAAAENSDEGDR